MTGPPQPWSKELIIGFDPHRPAPCRHAGPLGARSRCRCGRCHGLRTTGRNALRLYSFLLSDDCGEHRDRAVGRSGLGAAGVRGPYLTSTCCRRLVGRGIVERRPGWRMIARPLTTSHVPSHPRVSEPRRKCWAEQDVVDPQAGITCPAVALVVPEQIDRFASMLAYSRLREL